jgi:C4-dicarboxylate-specific signal transduction histidine kinase
MRDREWLTSALDVSQAGVWFWDRANDAIACSDTLGPLWGLAAGACHRTYRAYIAAIHPDDRRRVAGARKRALRSGFDFTEEYRVVWPDGSLHWLAERGMATRDPGGELSKLAGVVYDATRRRQVEETLRRREADLIQTMHLGSVQELISVLAHELNQPLAAILAYAEGTLRLLKKSPSPGGLDQTLSRIAQLAMRSAATVSRLRDVGRVPERHSRSADLNQSIRSLIRLLSDRIEREHVRISLDQARDLPVIAISPLKLEQLLFNVIINGLDAMQTTAAGKRQLLIRTRVSTANEVELTVSDTGDGMDPETVRRAFEPFYTTKPASLGLGLTLCQHIVEQYGGRIVATPNDPKGTRITLAFPTEHLRTGNGRT